VERHVDIGPSSSFSTSGFGLVAGPGGGVHGNGGSHAGAGGRLPCAIVTPPCCATGGAYYLGPTAGDAVNPLKDWSNAWGSGGGISGARGGGRINMTIGGTLTIGSRGFISSDGAPTLTSNGGSGAGGVVVIRAKLVSGTGTISANGGPGSYTKALASGGGGRVAIEANTLAMDTTLISAAGGAAGASQEQAQCLNGGAGTVFLAHTIPQTNETKAQQLRSLVVRGTIARCLGLLTGCPLLQPYPADIESCHSC